MKVEIIPFKRSEYDRGSKKIVVDGEEWGTFTMEGHGCNGPSYHAHDHHGAVSERKRTIGSRKGEDIEHSFRPLGRRHWRYNREKPPATDEQLRTEVVRLIEAKALRSPAARAAEVEAEKTERLNRIAAAERREDAAIRRRAQEAVQEYVQPGQLAEVVGAVVAAMRWAQQQ